MTRKLAVLGTYSRPMSPEETAAFIRSEQDLWRPVVKQLDLAVKAQKSVQVRARREDPPRRFPLRVNRYRFDARLISTPSVPAWSRWSSEERNYGQQAKAHVSRDSAVCHAERHDPISAQSYPTKPIGIFVPPGPGGANDVLARILAPGLQLNLGQSVIVENRALPMF